MKTLRKFHALYLKVDECKTLRNKTVHDVNKEILYDDDQVGECIQPFVEAMQVLFKSRFLENMPAHQKIEVKMTLLHSVKLSKVFCQTYRNPKNPKVVNPEVVRMRDYLELCPDEDDEMPELIERGGPEENEVLAEILNRGKKQ